LPNRGIAELEAAGFKNVFSLFKFRKSPIPQFRSSAVPQFRNFKRPSRPQMACYNRLLPET